MLKSIEGSMDHREPSEGSRLLHELERTGEYVFHGSPEDELIELEARQAYNWNMGEKQEDGPPSVAATPYADIAIFRALARNGTTAFGFGEYGQLCFKASQEALDNAHGHDGFVYVLPKNAFQPLFGKPGGIDWRSLNSIKPIQVIRVKESDLPKGIKLIS